MDYIPGYTLLKRIAGYLPSFSFTNKYELFTGSVVPGLTAPTPVPVDDTTLPRWSNKKHYAKNDMVKYNGFNYTAVNPSVNVNPVRAIVDSYITVETNSWQLDGLNSKVIPFNPETDSEKTYFNRDIVNFDDMLYLCKSASKEDGCSSDFTKDTWEVLSSAIINPPTAPPSTNDSYLQQFSGSVEASISEIIMDFSIPDVPGESLVDKIYRIFGILYVYLVSIAVFFTALLIASFTANDLLHKEYPYRILAYMYSYYFVTSILYSDGVTPYIGGILIIYYLIRSFFFKNLSMSPIALYSILPLQEDVNYSETRRFPTLYTYPAKLRASIQEKKDALNILRLASHGDITEMLRRALRIPVKETAFSQELHAGLATSTPAATGNPTPQPSAATSKPATGNPTPQPSAPTAPNGNAPSGNAATSKPAPQPSALNPPL